MGKAPSFEEVQKRLKLIASAKIKVGLLQNAGATPDGMPLTELGAIHEFGMQDGRIPQRSWLRSTFKRTDAARISFTQALVKKCIEDESMTINRALGMLGAWCVARLQETITQRLTVGPEPQENAPSTIAAKGSSTPLLDTAQMKNAISWQIESKK